MTEAGLGTAQSSSQTWVPSLPFPYCSCKCHPWGSLEDQCHPKTGQCPCRPGVEGQTCDRCQLGFFGFSVKGCRGKEAGSFPGCPETEASRKEGQRGMAEQQEGDRSDKGQVFLE